MKVVIVGGSGLIGRIVTEKLRRSGDDVWVSTRGSDRPSGLHSDVGVLHWDTASVPKWDIPVDAVVNLAGESLIGGYWTAQRKKELWRSRAGLNQHLAAWIGQRKDPPRVFLTASGIGYYGPHPPGAVTEDHGPGDDFIANLVTAWEEAAFAAESDGTRVVATRFGVLLDPRGGALALMLPLWKAFLGGSVGKGHQPFPWVTTEDASRAIVAALHDPALRGPINVVAPERISNKEFTRALGRAVRRPAPWYVPPLALRMIYGDGAEILVHGQSAVPKRLQERSFTWHHPDIDTALEQIVGGD